MRGTRSRSTGKLRGGFGECYTPTVDAPSARISILSIDRNRHEDIESRMEELFPNDITPQEAWALVEDGTGAVFIDTRNARHWAASEVKIPGSLRIWREELAARIAEVPTGRPVITYCA